MKNDDKIMKIIMKTMYPLEVINFHDSKNNNEE